MARHERPRVTESVHLDFLALEKTVKEVSYKTAEYYACGDALQSSELYAHRDEYLEALGAGKNEGGKAWMESQLRITEAMIAQHELKVRQAGLDIPGYHSAYDQVSQLLHDAEKQDEVDFASHMSMYHARLNRIGYLRQVLTEKGFEDSAPSI